MDTTEVAEYLGTTPRVLRQFLRSPYSTFVAVGSGARYEFTPQDLPTLTKRFADWKGDGKPKPEAETKPAAKRKSARREHQDADAWEEEGNVVIPDIRDPRVRARVRREAQAAEDRLNLRLMARGLHVAQGWTPKRSA